MDSSSAHSRARAHHLVGSDQRIPSVKYGLYPPHSRPSTARPADAIKKNPENEDEGKHSSFFLISRTDMIIDNKSFVERRTISVPRDLFTLVAGVAERSPWFRK